MVKMIEKTLTILMMAALLLPGCDARGVMLAGGPADGGALAADAGVTMDTCGDAGAEDCAGPKEKFPYHDFYMELRAKFNSLPVDHGDWADDQGDAAYYGVAFYVGAGTAEKNSAFLDRARQGRQHDLTLVRAANNDLSALMNNLEENLMAELGLIEHMAASGDTKVVADVDTFLDNLNSLVESMGPYLEVDVNSWALKMYGPTTITGVIALINFRYAMLLKNDKVQQRLEFGRSIVKAIDDKVWTGAFYKFSTTVDRVDLYPNVMMAIVNTQDVCARVQPNSRSSGSTNTLQA